MAGIPWSIQLPVPLTGDRAKAAGADWKLSDEAKADIAAIMDNISNGLAMARFIRLGRPSARPDGGE